MKKIVFLILALFLASCGDDTTTSGITKIDNDSFSMNIPSTWEIIDDKSKLPETSNGEIELVATSTKMENGFANNILVLSDELNKLTTSKDYSILNNVGSKEDFLNYTELKSENIKFADGEESVLYVFEAKYNLDTPKLKFIQSANICNKTKGYFFTIAIPTSVDSTERYESLIKSFSCK